MAQEWAPDTEWTQESLSLSFWNCDLRGSSASSDDLMWGSFGYREPSVFRHMEEAGAEEGGEADAEGTVTRRNPNTLERTLRRQLLCAWGDPCPEEAFTSFGGTISSHMRRAVCCLEPLP